jgi:prevent-host-death family protein
VTTIAQRGLRNNVRDVLRRAENGERFAITVNGRPVAELGPANVTRFADPVT